MDSSTKVTTLYREINVWKRLNQQCAVRYRCFEIIGGNRFCVQSADFFYYPIDYQQLKRSDEQFAELLIESDPDERAIAYSSIEEAIKRHEAEFEDFHPDNSLDTERAIT